MHPRSWAHRSPAVVAPYSASAGRTLSPDRSALRTGSDKGGRDWTEDMIVLGINQRVKGRRRCMVVREQHVCHLTQS